MCPHEGTLAPPAEYNWTCASFGPPGSTTQMANRPVQPFLHSSQQTVSGMSMSCHHRAALVANPCSDTVQAVSARSSGTERPVVKLRRRAATASHHKTLKSAVSWQEHPAHPMYITEVWGVGVQCCWSHSLEQPSDSRKLETFLYTTFYEMLWHYFFCVNYFI